MVGQNARMIDAEADSTDRILVYSPMAWAAHSVAIAYLVLARID